MEQEIDTLKSLLNERIVFDLGQFSKVQTAWLTKEVRAGRVQRLWNTQRHREGKWMYWIVS